jgi:hypothetical protein
MGWADWAHGGLIMAVRIWLKCGTPIDLPTGVDVEPTRFPAGSGCDGHAAIEVVDTDKNVVGCFRNHELAGFALHDQQPA